MISEKSNPINSQSELPAETQLNCGPFEFTIPSFIFSLSSTGPGGAGLQFVKHKIESLDKESMSMSYTVIEGDPMLAKAEAIAVELRVEAAADGGSKGEHITTVTPKPGVEVKAEEAMAGKGMAMAVLNAVDAYLVNNPQAYA
ncbi:unnamed protein product [Linum trigynum]|uniref:Bet v I/Major latex protein domain-containing protein n=1 Tax=Linum trigynum TaxID=586398 RepID=A0AAV2FGC7_9ROSI